MTIKTKALFTGKLEPHCLSLCPQGLTLTLIHLQTQAATHSLSSTLFLAATIFYRENSKSADLCWNAFISRLNLSSAFSGRRGQQTLHLFNASRPSFALCECSAPDLVLPLKRLFVVCQAQRKPTVGCFHCWMSFQCGSAQQQEMLSDI